MNKDLMLRKTKTIRDVLEDPKMKAQLQMAIPRHLTVDRLLRTVMTAIRTNPTLLDCTRESLLAAVMACAQLGLEPEPFLGQAYLVPFKNKGVLEVVFIPGYRGYIALARRSGEVQSVNAQVVYENDHFILQYGTDEKLEHRPTDGDRGQPKGAYVIFKYKDGGHSFDYMTTADINRIRDKFSKQPNGLMWGENWPTAAVKTVTRKHIKFVPLNIEEMRRAVALEDRAYAGESQFDMVFPEREGQPQIEGGSIETFQTLLAEKTGHSVIAGSLHKFIQTTAEAHEITDNELMAEASKDFDGFWSHFEQWEHRQEEGKQPSVYPFANLKKSGLSDWEKKHRNELTTMPVAAQKAFMEKWERVMGMVYPAGSEVDVEVEPAGTGGEDESITCPNTGEEMKASYCSTHYCKQRDGCPVWEGIEKEG